MARDKGSGSVYYDKQRDRWRGALEVGYNTKGNRRQVRVSARTKRECIQKLADKRRELAVSGPPAEDVREQTTIKGFSDEWLKDEVERLDPSAYDTTKAAVSNWIVPTIGKRRLNLVTARDVRSVHTAIRDAGRSESTVARYHGVLMRMLKDAARDGYPILQSALLAESVAPGKSDRDAIPLEHVALILEQARLEPDYSRWLAAFLEGLRPAEALGLEWDRVDFERGALEISWQLKALPYNKPRDRSSGFRMPRGYESRQIEHSWHFVRPKTDAGDRWIPLHSALAAELQAWREECPSDTLVWPNITGVRARAYGGPREDKPDRATWKRLCEQAGVPDYDLYAARHTTASLLRDMGVPEEIITMIMGHSSMLSTKAYIHTTMAKASKELERATKQITGHA
ncbi:tyrosine-type recombinase/integrase [Actinomycetaceae bacterium MB13-C1-2]|nr:tyrosine-type recombinase/integrase [Actinomycetaceae bacterium MB13-C1-2]